MYRRNLGTLTLFFSTKKGVRVPFSIEKQERVITSFLTVGYSTRPVECHVVLRRCSASLPGMIWLYRLSSNPKIRGEL